MFMYPLEQIRIFLCSLPSHLSVGGVAMAITPVDRQTIRIDDRLENKERVTQS